VRFVKPSVTGVPRLTEKRGGGASPSKIFPFSLQYNGWSCADGVAGSAPALAVASIEILRLALRKPDLVLWQLGTNDALARIPSPEFEETVRSTIRWLKDNQIDVVLVGVQYTTRLVRDANYLAIRDSLQKIAAEEKTLYVRRYDAMRFIAQRRANLQLMAGDNFHLNDLGYHCMAEHVAHALIVSLFAKRARPAQN
jgi:acyl-CoA thioesterase I